MKAKEKIGELLSLIPEKSSSDICWRSLRNTDLGIIFSKMEATAQNPVYHGEGNVFLHTKAVCESLISLEEYQNLSNEDRQILFLAALFHDIGKIRCTRTEDGEIVSPHHAAIGAVMTREILWRQFGLCGSREKQQLREAVCFLVRYHSVPPYSIKDENASLRLLKIASNGLLAPHFSSEKLCIPDKADIHGSICPDGRESLDKVDFCRLLAEEAGCLTSPYPFLSDYSRRAFFLEKTKWCDQEMYNDSFGEVILMSGLPGTGKSTWIKENCSAHPVISLDDIRKEMGVSPTENQGKVIVAAREKARELLRKKQPFVWDATNISSDIRSKQIALFEQYGASVRTVFLETEWEEELKRNRERANAVPLPAIEKMISKLEIPEAFECEKVVWETV